MFLQKVNKAITFLLYKADLFRCEDGTEFDTHFSSLTCLDCEGVFSPSSEAEWSCSNCNKKRDSKQCTATLEKLDAELKCQTENADYSKETVLQFEKVIHLDCRLPNCETHCICSDSAAGEHLERSS